jgi:hypothetical protein
MKMQHKTVSGKILYTSRKPGMEGVERGREYFTFTTHTDGKRTLRATCEIEEPNPTVLRDVTYSINEHGMPMDCFIRLTVGDEFVGSGWFRMTDDYIECESYGPKIGRVSQRMPIIGEYHGFGTHPICGDGYATKSMDRSRGPHTRPFRVFLPSRDHRGATPPLLDEVNIQQEFVGEETVTVQAGTFDCFRYRYTDEHGGMATENGAHPSFDLWVTADDDAIFVKGGVGGYMMTWYELVELTRR